MKSRERVDSLLRVPKLLNSVLFQGRYDFAYDQMPLSIRGLSFAKRWNLAKAGMNLIYRRTLPWSMPLHMQIELTNYCNLRCPVCAAGSRSLTRRPVAMDVDLFGRLIDQVGPYLLTLSLWGWGEPALHPHLSQILSKLQKYGIAVLLSTNGQNLDDERVIQALIESPPVFLIVAIDGLTDETNSVFRVGAKLEPILSGVRRLAEIKRQRGLTRPLLHMRYMVMRHNQHELPALTEFAARHEFDLLTIRTLSIIDTEEPDRIHRPFVPDAPEFRAYDYQDGERVRRKDFYCLQPFWFPTVFADGTVAACEQDYNAQAPLGTLTGTSFADVWSSRPAARVRRSIRETPEAHGFCRNCPFVDRPVTDASVQVIWLNANLPVRTVIAPPRTRIDLTEAEKCPV